MSRGRIRKLLFNDINYISTNIPTIIIHTINIHLLIERVVANEINVLPCLIELISPLLFLKKLRRYLKFIEASVVFFLTKSQFKSFNIQPYKFLPLFCNKIVLSPIQK